MGKLFATLRQEFSTFHPRLSFVRFLLWFCPPSSMHRIRIRLLRLGGLNIGHGTVMADVPSLTGPAKSYKNLSIGENCFINIRSIFDLGDKITLGDNVYLAHQVTLITSSHEIGYEWHRAAAITAAPIHIEEGCWLGANVTVLPGVTIGRGSIVAAGAIVTKDLPSNVLAAGIPARKLKDLPLDHQIDADDDA